MTESDRRIPAEQTVLGNTAQNPERMESDYERSVEKMKKAIAQANILVLVVEDDPMSRMFMGKMLERLGVEVEFAKDGLEALRLYTKNEYDMIFLDIQMPVMNGYETAELIREQETMTAFHIPIIAVTAYALEEDQEKCLQIGMNAYLSKPVTMEDMVRMIAKYCELD